MKSRRRQAAIIDRNIAELLLDKEEICLDCKLPLVLCNLCVLASFADSEDQEERRESMEEHRQDVKDVLERFYIKKEL